MVRIFNQYLRGPPGIIPRTPAQDDGSRLIAFPSGEPNTRNAQRSLLHHIDAGYLIYSFYEDASALWRKPKLHTFFILRNQSIVG